MRITVVRPGELGPAEAARWRELQQSSSSLDNPFLSVEFTQVMGELRSYVNVAVIEDEGKIAGFFPFERHKFGVGKPLGGFLTTWHGVIANPALRLPARVLMRACRMSVFDFDHMVSDQATFTPYRSSAHPVPIMDLSAGFEPYIAQVRANSSKNYKTVRYKERKLAREVGALHFDWCSGEVGTLRTLTGWKSDQYRRTGRTDRFAQPWIVELVERLQASDSPHFGGVLTMIYADGEPVAGHFGLRTATTLVGWFPAYNTAYLKYSPGIVHHLHMAEHAASAGLHRIDMGRGGKQYKNWLKNGDLEVIAGRVVRPSAAAAVHFLSRAPLSRARDVVTSRPSLYRAADRLLKGFGRLRTSGRSSHSNQMDRQTPDVMRTCSGSPHTNGRSNGHLPDLAGTNLLVPTRETRENSSL
ncbi:GNAT family N-acetyltransferase [Sinosporangium siamense]|uniref:BioF2-like acetyltransferase domain-containing protein n=1 Tax=Sinosporangium siamense TaxID=1367973 RepID=A0A919V612_9ACTN|nr:GNAT family N-acetyltransferase [Sinosporangium siamense]GII91486.1 hypothetical protein Ssi02_17170 [Sinosporangium siamense]